MQFHSQPFSQRAHSRLGGAVDRPAGGEHFDPENRSHVDDVAALLFLHVRQSGGKAIGFATDVTKRAEVEALIRRAVDTFGRVDVLLNNAGIMPIAPIEALRVDEWDRQIDVNIKGLLYGVAAALPHMQKQK